MTQTNFLTKWELKKNNYELRVSNYEWKNIIFVNIYLIKKTMLQLDLSNKTEQRLKFILSTQDNKDIFLIKLLIIKLMN